MQLKANTAGVGAAWIPVLKGFGLFGLRRDGGTGFSLHCGKDSFFFFLSSCYVRGESLPTAPLCFCFSQWANVSLPRPHSLSCRPLSWKYSLAESSQGQAREVEGGGGGLFQQITWSYAQQSQPYTRLRCCKHILAAVSLSSAGLDVVDAWSCK